MFANRRLEELKIASQTDDIGDKTWRSHQSTSAEGAWWDKYEGIDHKTLERSLYWNKTTLG